MPKYRLSDNSVIDLEGYSQEAIDFFLEENEDAVLVKDNDPVKTEAVATETAPVTAVNEAVDTDLASEDISLEQFDVMEVAEKKKLSYRDRQRLLRERHRRDKGGIDSFDVSSDDYSKIKDEEKIKLQEEASKQLLKEYEDEGVVDFKITSEQIDKKAIKLLKEKTQPSLIESLGAQTARGFASFVKNSSDFATMVDYSLTEAALSAFDDQWEGTPEQKQTLMNTKSFGLTGASAISMASQNFISALEPSIREYETQTITEDLENGDYLQAGQRAVGAALESLPSIVAASTGVGGIIALGASSAGGKFEEEFGKDPSISTGTLVANALATGGVEAGFELVTRGILKRSGILADTGMKKAAEDLIRGGTQKLLAQYGINTVGEFASEAGTKVSTLVLDSAPKWIGGLDRNLDWSKEWRGILDEGIVGSVFGISATTIGGVKNRNVNAVAAAESILMPQDGKQAVIKSANKISELNKDRILADTDGVEILDKAIKTEILNIEKIKRKNSQALGSMNPKEIKAYASNNFEIDKLKSTVNKPNQLESVKKLAEQDLKNLTEANNTIYQEAPKRRLKENIESVEKLANKVEGVSVKSLDNAEAIETFIVDNKLDIDKKASGSQGFIYQNSTTGEQTIVINKEVAGQEQAVNVAGHEFLHALLFQTVKENTTTQLALGNSLKSYLDKVDASQVKDSNFAKRLDQYKEDPNNVKAEEVITLFSDALATGDIKFNENVFTKIGDVIRRALQSVGVNVKFNTGQDVYKFVKDYNKSVSKGKLNRAQIKASKGVKGDLVTEGVVGEAKAGIKESKPAATTLETINALVPIEVTSKEQYFDRKVFNPIYKATEPNGVISNYIKSKSPSKEVAEKTIASVQERLVNYDPTAERKKAGNKQPITFGEFIFANTNFGKLDAKKALFKESEAAKKTTDLDTKEAQGKIAEDDVVKKDRPKFRKLIDSGVLPGFTIKEIGGKLTKVLKVLKSKLDTKVSINKSVSPLIAEIKKAMGKQADIDLKEAMGGKADAKLQKWLLKNKKAVLENMTTTWLMGAIPQAIQKSVGGTYKVDDAGTRVKDSYGDFIFTPNFTSDWQGKTIDREKTSTNKSGKTAGGDIVRRLPNIATALSDADFVGSVLQDVSIDTDGKMTSGAPIRGKKESMAKAIAEEISLEVFNKELQNENSEISKAFENNQVAKGVVLVDSFTEDIARQSERGTVKFSLSNMSIVQNALFQDQNRKEQLKARIESAGGNIGENYKGLLGMLKEVYQGVDELESKLLPISKALYNVLKPYVKKDAKIALAKTGLTISELLENSFDSIDFSETIVQITGATSSVAAINSDLTSIAEAKEAVLKAFKNVEPSAVLSFISSTFANSGKVGRYKDGILGTSGASRADLWQNAEQAVNALKEFYPNTDWDAVNRDYSATAKVNKAHLGKLDVDKEIAKADAAWDFTVAIIKELKNIENPNIRALIMATMNSGTNTALRVAAPAIWRSSVLPSMNSKDYRYEHAVPARVVMALLYDRYVNNNTDIDVEALKKDYVVAIIPVKMDDVIGEVGFSKMMLAGYVPGKSPWYQRYYNVLTRGKVQYAIESQVDGEIIGESYVDYYNQANKITIKESRSDGSIKANTQQKAINNASSIKWSKSAKKIRVFDFDDTLARTKSNVLYTMPDGTTGKIDAATFAKDAGKMEAEGAQWDFSEFSKVMDGKAGPLLEVAKIIADKRGTKDVFVLTARPADAAGPIQEFLASMGLNIPIENITGLGNGAPKAKADWMVGKVAEGYNDFYFADDHTGNVKAVKDVFNTFDVKGKVQLAKVKFSKGLDAGFNSMIQRQKGVESFKEFSKATAKRRGKKTGKWKFFISPSAEDFRGLTQYKFAGKGKQGEADQKFFEESLMDPYFQGVCSIRISKASN